MHSRMLIKIFLLHSYVHGTLSLIVCAYWSEPLWDLNCTVVNEVLGFVFLDRIGWLWHSRR